MPHALKTKTGSRARVDGSRATIELAKTRRISLADLEETRRTFTVEVLADKARETFTLAPAVRRLEEED